jgi:hypothetical protein
MAYTGLFAAKKEKLLKMFSDSENNEIKTAKIDVDKQSIMAAKAGLGAVGDDPSSPT